MKDKIYINTKHIIDNNKKFKLEYIKVNDESKNPIEIDIGIRNPIFEKDIKILFALCIFGILSTIDILIEGNNYIILLLIIIGYPYLFIRNMNIIKSDITNYIEKIFKSIENDNIEKYDKLYYSFKFKINIKKITNIRIFIYLLEL